MTNEFEKKLLDIFIEIAKKETSFQRTNDLFEKAQELGDNASKEEITNEAKETMAKIFVMFVGKNRDFVEKWIGGEINPSNDQLNLLESNCEEILENIDKINQKVPQVVDNDYCSKTKEGVKKLKQKVQQEKRNRKNKGSTNQQAEQENPIQNTQQKDNTQQNEQIQKLQKEIELLTQQLFELQKQNTEILELLKKNQDSNEPAKKQEIQQKLTEVQTKQQQVQNQLEEKKQTQQEILANKNEKPKQEPKETESNSETKNDKFNWLYVVIPLGVLVLVFGGIVVYFLSKKKQKKM